MFAELHTLIATRAEEASGPDINGLIAERFEGFKHLQAVETYGETLHFGESNAKEMHELKQTVAEELKAGDLVWVMVTRQFNDATPGIVCQVAASEFAWLDRCNAVRRATDDEIAERKAMDEPPADPGKSLTRARKIRDKCQALRGGVANK